MTLKTFKFFWTTHKWTGIILAVVFAMIATTGFLLLVKKQFDWIQPPTMRGVAGEWRDFITTQRLFEVVLEQQHPDFATVDDVARVDFRPDRRLFKVQSVRNYAEIQVDAITGDVLRVDHRMSDLIENIHDGSIFGEWVHTWVMPLVAICLMFLVFSGLWLWVEPIVRRRRRGRRDARS